MNYRHLQEMDPEVFQAVADEVERQRAHIELIASENFASTAVRAAEGSVLTNKYAEGYPQKRYYNGCEFVHKIEQLAIDRAKALFGGAGFPSAQADADEGATAVADHHRHGQGYHRQRKDHGVGRVAVGAQVTGVGDENLVHDVIKRPHQQRNDAGNGILFH